jgi:competence protein CoiA
MAFRAVHTEWGVVFAHLPDLGCGQRWDAVWKVRPTAPLTCDECGHPMYAKVSRNGLRFFAHAPDAPNCALALETLAHHLLKLELANAARDAGAQAELEVRGPDGTWRADVLASDHGGTWQMALEAQLSPITAADITARTERMRADGVTSIWFSDQARPTWLGTVPSARLAWRDDGQCLLIAEGLVRFDGRRWGAVPATLIEFLDWAFTDRIVPHWPVADFRSPLTRLARVWTAPHYIRAETDHLNEEVARAVARMSAEERKLDAIRRKNLVIWHAAWSKAAEIERAARGTAEGARRRVWAVQRPGVRQLVGLLADNYDITVSIGWSTGDPRYAGGIPLVTAGGALAAVFNPVPSRVRGEAFLLLADTLLLFPSRHSQLLFEEAMERAGCVPLDGWCTVVADSGPPCTCITPKLAVVLTRRRYTADPSEMPDSTSLGHAECEACGRWYPGPWRLTARQAREKTVAEG